MGIGALCIVIVSLSIYYMIFELLMNQSGLALKSKFKYAVNVYLHYSDSENECTFLLYRNVGLLFPISLGNC